MQSISEFLDIAKLGVSRTQGVCHVCQVKTMHFTAKLLHRKL